MTDHGVTEAHLQAVRAELHARLAEHKAEVHVTMRELTSEVRGARSEQQRENRDVKATLKELMEKVDEQESGTDREKWMDDLRKQIVRKTAAGLTLATAMGGVLIALLDYATK